MEGSGLTQVNDQYNTQVMHCKIKICGQFDLSIELESAIHLKEFNFNLNVQMFD